MPTVRITRKIKREILLNAQKVAESQRDNLPEADETLGKNIVHFIIDKYNLPIKGHADVINEVNTIHFSDLSHLIEIGDPEEEYELNVAVNPPIKMMLPQIFGFSKNQIWLNFNNVNPEFSETITDELKLLVNMRVDIEIQCDNFIKTIQDLLGRCTTLKQFIEAWPQGEQFIGPTALRQHYDQEKKQRKRGVYLDDDILSDLNSILLTSKII